MMPISAPSEPNSLLKSHHSLTPTRWLAIMPNLKLKKLLTRKEISNLLDQLALVFNPLPTIRDETGEWLWGNREIEGEQSFPIQKGSRVIGWVEGNQKAGILASFLNCFVHQELEKRSLANEILQRYEEVNFLSDFSAKVSCCVGLEEVVSVIIRETQNLLKANDILIFLYEPSLCSLISPVSLSESSQGNFRAIFEIAHQTLINGKTAVIDDIVTDDRYIRTSAQGRSLMIAPLKIQNQTIGIFATLHNEPHLYNSEDLNLFSTLSSQAAAAIQTVQYYEKLKNYSQNLEQEVAERTRELQLATAKLEQANLELKRLATHDELTQIANRRYFNQYLEQQWKSLHRERQPLSLILCDVDYFKAYNDHYFHQAGDRCLQKVAGLISQSLKRPADLAARYGGEEFAVILPNTNAEGAKTVAERIQSELLAAQIPHFASKVSPWVTLSFGVSTIIPSNLYSLEEFIRITDKALFNAKEGRNRISVHSLTF